MGFLHHKIRTVGKNFANYQIEDGGFKIEDANFLKLIQHIQFSEIKKQKTQSSFHDKAKNESTC